ncbi:MAG: argonaute/piwi family protein [Acidimicrobiales bacterium]
MGELLGGPPLLAEVERVAKVLGEQPLNLAHGLTCSVGEPLRITNSPDYKSVVATRQLDYCFDPARTKRHRYAWPGLESYGPFSRDTFARPSPQILVVFPKAAQGAVEKFVRSLRDGIPGQKSYQAGFTKTFGLVNPRFEMVAVPPGADRTPAEAYRHAIEGALARGDLPDAALVIVTDHDGDLPDEVNPYLHSKAMLLMAGVATQHARLSKISSQPGSLQYILQNISIALYAKMRGVPWTVDHDLTIADELVIGIGTAELSDSRIQERHRYVGITTVFRGDGNYLLGQLSREATYAEYPAVLRDSTRSILEELKQRNGWQPGDTVRVVIHAARPPRNLDFALLMHEAVQAVGKDQHIEFAFVTVSHDHPFALFDTAQPGQQSSKGTKGEFVPDRGLIVQTSRYSRLITTTGLTLVKRAGLPLARPIQVHLHRHSTFKDLHYLSEQVLKFTGLSWRSTSPAADPVTIYYSELIARHLARLRAVPGWSPTLLDARLRTSKWFL